MFQTLRNAWKIEDLRKKLLFTLLILVIVRLGCAIPVPFLDPSRLQEMLDSTQGNLLGYLNLLTGGAFAEATLFALGVSPLYYGVHCHSAAYRCYSLPGADGKGRPGRTVKRSRRSPVIPPLVWLLLQAYAYYTPAAQQPVQCAVKYTTGAAGVDQPVLPLCWPLVPGAMPGSMAGRAHR